MYYNNNICYSWILHYQCEFDIYLCFINTINSTDCIINGREQSLGREEQSSVVIVICALITEDINRVDLMKSCFIGFPQLNNVNDN